MNKLIRICKRTLFVFLVLFPISSFAHYILFPRQTRSILIDYADFQKDGRLYYNAHTSPQKVDSVKSLIKLAFLRIDSFWGKRTCNPKYIYCDDVADFRKFGSYYNVPALTHIKLGAYIVLSADGADADIITHELAHAEFYERIGFYNWTFKIPRCFDEGSAMQEDHRNYYPEDTLKALSDNFKNLPDIKKPEAGSQFEQGSAKHVMLNFMTAKHEVKKWYTGKRMEKSI